MRNRCLTAALVAILTAAIGPVAKPSAAYGADKDGWGQAASHATGDYFNPGESKLTPSAVAQARRRWSVPLAPAKCARPSIPLIGANRLVTAASYRISGYDATTGARKWRTPAAGRRHLSLIAIAGQTLVAQYRDCRSNKLYLTALNVRTGTPMYTRPIVGLMYSPVADKGVVVGGIWDEAISSYGLRAYRISDGAQVWARQGSISGEAVSAGGRIMVFGNDEPNAALDISTGKRLWGAGAGCYRPVGASPDGAKFYMSCAERPRIQVVDAATGKVTATFPAYGTVNGFATDGKRVYMQAFAGGILAVDATTGSKAWSRSFADSAPVMFSTGGGVVYGWRGSGHPIAAFEAKTGKVIKLDAKTAAIEGQPLIANGRLYGRTASTVTTFAP